ncbi:MAG: hypothetical protein ACK56I_27560, partial [bacterium]
CGHLMGRRIEDATRGTSMIVQAGRVQGKRGRGWLGWNGAGAKLAPRGWRLCLRWSGRNGLGSRGQAVRHLLAAFAAA